MAPLEYAQPLLKQKNAHVQFNLLLCAALFRSRDHFQSEYLLMWDKQQIADHFGAELYDQHQGKGLLKCKEPGSTSLEYQYWAWRTTGREAQARLPWDRLMSRERMERWLYAHFLKICLPARRDPDADAQVRAPLNLTAFLRLVVHLHENGYPSHWLATVLGSLAAGRITTSARAPRKQAMDVGDVDKVYPPRQMSVAAWTAEFTTLLGIWRGLMPFGFGFSSGTAKDASSASVHPTDVYEYSVVFSDFEAGIGCPLRVPHFTLVFCKGKSRAKFAGRLRETLLDDEVGDVSARAKGTREKGVHVVTTFTYVTDTRIASFWMRRDVADMFLTPSAGWQVSIWRVDSWKQQVADVPVVGRMVRGQCWA